jgi:hypothetical protein
VIFCVITVGAIVSKTVILAVAVDVFPLLSTTIKLTLGDEATGLLSVFQVAPLIVPINEFDV